MMDQVANRAFEHHYIIVKH